MRRHVDSSPTADPFDRLLGLFTDVHAGEGARATLMMVNIFLILLSYYILKTVREPLILTGLVPQWLAGADPAEMKTYSAAGQALALMVFVPAYSWFASRVNHMKLVYGVTLFYIVDIVVFALAVQWQVRYIGVFFYIWLGLFNMSIVAQFWSYANDIYTRDAGHRLFPIIAVGMTAGAPVGTWITGRMFTSNVEIPAMLFLGAGLLLLTGVLYGFINRGEPTHHPDVASAPIRGRGALSLVFTSRYIRSIVVLLILLNVCNTVGGYILDKIVVTHVAEAVRADRTFNSVSYTGAFYASYYFWVSVVSMLLQIFIAPRLVKRFGLTGALFALPFISLGGYALVTFAATAAVVWAVKTAENSTDYSIMNTARGLLWLPTSREEKYKAKQAVDTFFVRIGDLAAAFVVFLGRRWLFGPRGFAALNVVFAIAWLAVAAFVLRENHRLSAETVPEKVVA